ncbi:hypothetical protein THRCLA_00397 [Thraustotheca clavata]|uniref:Uncharacterized protein n=1 Tax=Thraustotheca clavata TaxID=74557 RepID=A0A1W0ABA9_9STRA|nr:hypothetical protein THRCLA_00397 [Thraustotheca clavata]
MTKLHIAKAIDSTSPKKKYQSNGQGSGENPTNSKLLRTKLLQRVVDLLEKDDSMVEFVSSIVDSMGKVPLEQDTMRRAFLAQLNQDKKTMTCSSTRSSGRPKRLNVHHCREFILACVNEIVDLEDTDPAFDYAESIAESDTMDSITFYQPKIKVTMQECLVRPASPLNKIESTFDYCETLTASSQMDVATHLRNVIKSYQDRVQCQEEDKMLEEDYVDDETFNKVRAYAHNMAIKRRAFQEFKRQMPMEPASPIKEKSSRLSRRTILLEELPTKVISPCSSPLKEYASKYNTFDKLKRNRANSPLNRQRKTIAIQQFKKGTKAYHINHHTVRQVVVMTLVILLAIVWLHDEFQLL